MRRNLALVLLVFTLIVYPVIALGADGSSSATSELLTWLLGLVASVVLVLVQRAIQKWIAPKVSKETADLLEKIADGAVRYAEERGRAVLKADGQKLASNEKLERASQLLMAEADKFGVKDLDIDRARKYVEAALSKTREIPASAARPPVPFDTNGKVGRV